VVATLHGVGCNLLCEFDTVACVTVGCTTLGGVASFCTLGGETVICTIGGVSLLSISTGGCVIFDVCDDREP
jgi:hypothetical protein